MKLRYYIFYILTIKYSSLFKKFDIISKLTNNKLLKMSYATNLEYNGTCHNFNEFINNYKKEKCKTFGSYFSITLSCKDLMLSIIVTNIYCSIRSNEFNLSKYININICEFAIINNHNINLDSNVNNIVMLYELFINLSYKLLEVNKN